MTLPAPETSQRMPLAAMILAAPTIIFWMTVLLFHAGFKTPYARLFAPLQSTPQGPLMIAGITFVLPGLAFAVSAFYLRNLRNKKSAQMAVNAATALLVVLLAIYLWRAGK